MTLDDIITITTRAKSRMTLARILLEKKLDGKPWQEELDLAKLANAACINEMIKNYENDKLMDIERAKREATEGQQS